MNKNLALFDFDGTLTTKDSLGEFIKFAKGSVSYYLGLVKFIPYFLKWKLGFIKNYEAKQMLMQLFFKDIDEEEFKILAKEYSLSQIDMMLRDKTYQLFLKHIKDEDKVLIVSASMRCWLEPWVTKHGVELLSTELEFIDKKFSGKFSTKNCHGEEKVQRIKEHIKLDDYSKIYAYGDSSGDKEMLELADVKYYKAKRI